MDGSAVDDAAAEMVRVLEPHTDRDWRGVRAGTLEWSCWTTAAHVAHDLMAYAGQVAAQPREQYLPFDLTIRESASPAEVLMIVRASAGLLRSIVTAADRASRGWHWGPTDPGGFAALGVNETLMHTVDITHGLTIDWAPPADLCTQVLARLFPEAPPGDPVEVLLWCTGRGELPGHERKSSWVLKAARPE